MGMRVRRLTYGVLTLPGTYKAHSFGLFLLYPQNQFSINLSHSCIQISSTYIKSYDKILDCMSHIGDTLPHFENYRQIFQDNETIKHVLCLFYRDILDFHAIAIHFFGWKSK